ncbi:acetate--CoA ligase family protein [Pseudonocardia xishanensis]|uniref:Acetate--CoA ligase family protein n=1 Tax=Pseudonocardia xishanensis TaxID=630995 RepID=A0ABP8RV85_9PSEU
MSLQSASSEEIPLARLFAPRSVALVGVSGDPAKAMSRPLRYLAERGYTGKIHPVNPRYREILGIPCHPTLAEVPGPVDLVLSFVPAAATAEVVEAAAKAGAVAVVVFASGFGETGPEGAQLQEQLRDVAARHGIRVVGPNCQGLMYAPSHLFATFTGAVDRELPPASGIAYVGQSGAVGGSVLDLAAELGVGLTAWVSTGNQVDLDLVEIARTLVMDEAVRVVMLYAEGIGDGARFTALCREARDRGVRIVLLRTGRSESGKRAAASHTGSMLGDDAALSLVCHEEGVLQVDDVDELLVGAIVAANPPAGGRAAIVTTSGGAGGLAADQCDLAGLTVPELSAAVRERLAPLIPSFGAVANPVDVTAEILSPKARERSLGEVCRILADAEIDFIQVVLTMVTGDAAAALARDLVRTLPDLPVPVYLTWLAGNDLTLQGRALLHEAGVPAFASVSSVTRAVGRLLAPVRERRSSTAESDDELMSLVRTTASGSAGDVLLDRLGVDHPRSAVATTATEAAVVAAAGGSFALKIHSPSLLHKSDVGGVELGVDAADVPAAFERLQARGAELDLPDLRGILVQEMIPSGTELILALTSGGDGFPSILTVGVGGVTTELYRDLASATAPVDEAEAEDLLRRLRGWPLLDGFRGSPRADVAAATRAIAAFSRLGAVTAGHRLEVEVNPLVVGVEGAGAKAADILVTTDMDGE